MTARPPATSSTSVLPYLVVGLVVCVIIVARAQLEQQRRLNDLEYLCDELRRGRSRPSRNGTEPGAKTRKPAEEA